MPIKTKQTKTKQTKKKVFSQAENRAAIARIKKENAAIVKAGGKLGKFKVAGVKKTATKKLRKLKVVGRIKLGKKSKKKAPIAPQKNK